MNLIWTYYIRHVVIVKRQLLRFTRDSPITGKYKSL